MAKEVKPTKVKKCARCKNPIEQGIKGNYCAECSALALELVEAERRNHHQVGRPSKLNEVVKKRLIGALERGAYKEDACHYAGISVATFYRWMDKGEAQEKGEYKQFREAVELAEANSTMISLDTIVKAEQEGDWRAAAWKLERRQPDRWGRVERQTIKAEHSGEIRITINPKVKP